MKIITELPNITKEFKLENEENVTVNKKFKYTNPFNENKKFTVIVCDPLFDTNKNNLSLGPNESSYVHLEIKPGKKRKIFVLINNEEGNNEEGISIDLL